MKLKMFEEFNRNQKALDEFWDAHYEELIKYVDDNHEMMPDTFAGLGLDQESIDAEMDGTSKHQALTLLNMYGYDKKEQTGEEGLKELLAMIQAGDE